MNAFVTRVIDETMKQDGRKGPDKEQYTGKAYAFPCDPAPVTVVSCLLHVFIPHDELPDCLTFGYQVQISLMRYAGRECEKVGFPLTSRLRKCSIDNRKEKARAIRLKSYIL